MKKIIIMLSFVLIVLSLSFSYAEKSEDEELPEGLYIYTPAQGKYLSWVENEQGNEYQVIGLAPHDSTVQMTLTLKNETIWQTDVMSEGNGYFFAAIPAERLKQEKNYQLVVNCLSYSKTIDFIAYEGSVSDFAMDPIHLKALGDLGDEKWFYENEMKELSEPMYSEEDYDDELFSDEPVQTGPNEYRNKEFSYVLLEDGTVQLVHYYGHKKHLILPEVVDGYTVSRIKFSGHNEGTGVMTVTIPSGIQFKDDNFHDWKDLTSFCVPQDHSTFSSVNGILYSRDLRTVLDVPVKHPDKDLIVPEGTTRLAYCSFFMSSMRRITLPETLRSIGVECFAYAMWLREIVIPDSVRVLEENCFRSSGINRLVIPSNASVTKGICGGCSNLESITVMPGNETVQSVDGVLFSADGETLMTYPAKKSLREYTVPFGTVEIADLAFNGAEKLDSIVIPESVTRLGERVFEGASVQSITIPDSCTDLADSSLNGCFKLKEFIIKASHPTLDAVEGKYLYSKDHSVFYCYPLGITAQSYEVEEGTKVIATGAFDMAPLLTVVLPETLEEIGGLAFCGSKLRRIYVPGSVKTIRWQAFSYCFDLEEVGIGYGVENLDRIVFTGSSNLKGVSLPETVINIGELAFLNTGVVRIFTTEGSFAHQYALQNHLNCDVAPGNYETFTHSVKEGTDPFRETGYASKYKVVIAKGATANIREKPDMGSRRVGRGEVGDEFDWLETVESGGVTWYKVELEDGTPGYIHSKMAELIE